MDVLEFDNILGQWWRYVIYIYIYIIFKKKIVLNPLQYKFAHLHHEPGPILFFKAQLKLQKKKKNVQKKILVFNLRNKKPINQILKNH